MSAQINNLVRGVEAIIGYHFTDPYMALEAVTAAGALIAGGA